MKEDLMRITTSIEYLERPCSSTRYALTTSNACMRCRSKSCISAWVETISIHNRTSLSRPRGGRTFQEAQCGVWGKDSPSWMKVLNKRMNCALCDWL